ncbi:MAG: hypothetical protein ACJ75H_07335 [Thermoanaerobaculia bacterium]
MSNPYAATEAVLADIELIKRFEQPYGDVVRQMQQTMEDDRRRLISSFQQKLAANEAAMLQPLLRDLEAHRDLMRQMSEKAALDVRSALEKSTSDILYQSRALIDPFIYSTLSASGMLLRQNPGSVYKFGQRLVQSYDKISKRSDSKAEKDLPRELKSIPTAEAFTSAEVVEEIAFSAREEPTETEIEERQFRRIVLQDLSEDTSVRLEVVLAGLGPEFTDVWRGAVQIHQTDNPERARYFTSSCRTLFDEVLDRFAPVGSTKAWLGELKPEDMDSQGNPKRRVRVRYMCRNLENSSGFAEFMEQDIDDVMELYQRYNKGVHRLKPSFSKEELDALKAKAAQHLLSLVKLGITEN